MDLKGIFPLLVLGFIAWHAKATVVRTLSTVQNLKSNFVVQQQLSVVVSSIRLAGLGEDNFTVPDDERKFAQLVRSTVRLPTGEDSSVDPWGTPYRHKTRGKTLTVYSAGPDKLWNTKDDQMQSTDLVGF